LRQNQRALNKAMRDLDRERQHMEQQEKKIIADIKKMAKQGQMVLVYMSLHCQNVAAAYSYRLHNMTPLPVAESIFRCFVCAHAATPCGLGSIEE